MPVQPKFNIVFLEEAACFLQGLPPKVQDKINYNIMVSQYEMKQDLFKKHVGTDIWEFRTLYNDIAYRLFAFWDSKKKAMVVATHGIIKKTQKTPSKEIKRAEEIMRNYYKLTTENGN